MAMQLVLGPATPAVSSRGAPLARPHAPLHHAASSWPGSSGMASSIDTEARSTRQTCGHYLPCVAAAMAAAKLADHCHHGGKRRRACLRKLRLRALGWTRGRPASAGKAQGAGVEADRGRRGDDYDVLHRRCMWLNQNVFGKEGNSSHIDAHAREALYQLGDVKEALRILGALEQLVKQGHPCQHSPSSYLCVAAGCGSGNLDAMDFKDVYGQCDALNKEVFADRSVINDAAVQALAAMDSRSGATRILRKLEAHGPLVSRASRYIKAAAGMGVEEFIRLCERCEWLNNNMLPKDDCIDGEAITSLAEMQDLKKAFLILKSLETGHEKTDVSDYVQRRVRRGPSQGKEFSTLRKRCDWLNRNVCRVDEYAVEALVSLGHLPTALSILDELQEKVESIDSTSSYVCVRAFAGCGQLGADDFKALYDQCRFINNVVFKRRGAINDFAINALAEMGDLQQAFDMLQSMKKLEECQPDSVRLPSSLICAKAGGGLGLLNADEFAGLLGRCARLNQSRYTNKEAISDAAIAALATTLDMPTAMQVLKNLRDTPPEGALPNKYLIAVAGFRGNLDVDQFHALYRECAWLNVNVFKPEDAITDRAIAAIASTDLMFARETLQTIRDKYPDSGNPSRYLSKAAEYWRWRSDDPQRRLKEEEVEEVVKECESLSLNVLRQRGAISRDAVDALADIGDILKIQKILRKLKKQGLSIDNPCSWLFVQADAGQGRLDASGFRLLYNRCKSLNAKVFKRPGAINDDAITALAKLRSLRAARSHLDSLERIADNEPNPSMFLCSASKRGLRRFDGPAFDALYARCKELAGETSTPCVVLTDEAITSLAELGDLPMGIKILTMLREEWPSIESTPNSFVIAESGCGYGVLDGESFKDLFEQCRDINKSVTEKKDCISDSTLLALARNHDLPGAKEALANLKDGEFAEPAE